MRASVAELMRQTLATDEEQAPGGSASDAALLLHS
jgi:hypothetical protein